MPGRLKSSTVDQDTSRLKMNGITPPPAIRQTIASDSAMAAFSGTPTR